MSTSNNIYNFIPLNPTSQNNKGNVLYYNANAPREAIYLNAMTRLKAAIQLLEIAKDPNSKNKPNIINTTSKR